MTVESMYAKFEHLQGDSSLKFPKSELIEAMNASDIEVLGIIYAYISEESFARRIEPELNISEVLAFLKRYLGRCIRENPDGDWSDSNYTAGADLVRWFVKLWKDKTNASASLELKHWLAEMYKNEGDDVRLVVVNGTLEHLFENKRIRAFFRDWKQDEVLRRAYDEACSWSAERPVDFDIYGTR